MTGMGTATYDQPVPTETKRWIKELAASSCDRCHAEARVLVGMFGGTLALCGHHWHAHEEELTKHGWTVLASSLDQLTAS